MVMSNKILSHREIDCFHCLVPIIYYLIQKTINTNTFHGLVPIIYYLIQKTMNTNSFHGHVQEDIIS
jgi:hypothetical protein